MKKKLFWKAILSLLSSNHLARFHGEFRETHSFPCPLFEEKRTKDFAIKTTPITSLLIIQKSRVARTWIQKPKSFRCREMRKCCSFAGAWNRMVERERRSMFVCAFCSANYHFVLILWAPSFLLRTRSFVIETRRRGEGIIARNLNERFAFVREKN